MTEFKKRKIELSSQISSFHSEDHDFSELCSEEIGVKCILIDFGYFSCKNENLEMSESFSTFMDLSTKFKQKMMFGKRFKRSHPIPFPENFDLVQSLQISTPFHPKISMKALDVKISYTHSCILVSVPESDMILVFDLITKTFKKSIVAALPKFLCVEEYFPNSARKNSDALLFSCGGLVGCCVFKYDLYALLEHIPLENDRLTYLWKCDTIKKPEGVAVSSSQNRAFVCDSSSASVKVLNLSTGEYIEEIKLQGRPVGIEVAYFGKDFKLLICNSSRNRVDVLQQSICGTEWELAQQLGESNLTQPCAVVFERVQEHIIVYDENHNLSVFTKQGTLVCHHNVRNGNKYLGGICINEIAGELFVCDYLQGKVRIYK